MGTKRQALLTYAQRKKMQSSEFALPSERKYPIPDVKHGRNALARAAQELKAGNLTQAQYAKIVAAVRRKFPQIGKK